MALASGTPSDDLPGRLGLDRTAKRHAGRYPDSLTYCELAFGVQGTADPAERARRDARMRITSSLDPRRPPFDTAAGDGPADRRLELRSHFDPALAAILIAASAAPSTTAGPSPRRIRLEK